LRQYFDGLRKPVSFVLQTGEHDKRSELVAFLSDIAELSDNLTLHERDSRDDGRGGELRSPISFALEADGEPTGIVRATGQPQLPLQDVTVIGGGPAGVSAAIYSARKGLEVTLIAERLGGQVKDTMGIENLISVPTTTGPELAGALQNHLNEYHVTVKEHLRVAAVEQGDVKTVTLTSGVFIQIGLVPNSQVMEGVVELSQYGEIVVDEKCRTSEPGIYACGDVTTVPYKQIPCRLPAATASTSSSCSIPPQA
jgi:alkyl hydroperoxide reductase subunit AhpF